MKVWHLIRVQFKKNFNEVMLSLIDIHILIGYLLFLITAISISLGLYFFYFNMPELSTYFINNIFLKEINTFNILIHLYVIWSLFRGVSRYNFYSIFESFDLELLFSYPINSKNLYFSKYVVKAFIRAVIIFAMIIISYPIILYYNFSNIIIMMLYMSIFLFVEINYFISYILFNIVYNDVLKKYIKILFIITVLIIFLYIIDNTILTNVINFLIPSFYLMNTLNSLFMKTQNMNIYILFSQIFIYLIFLIISYFISDNYYELAILKNNDPNIYEIKFLEEYYSFERLLESKTELIFFIKDIYLHIRNHGRNFIIQFCFEYISLLIIIFLRPLFDIELFSNPVIYHNLTYLVLPLFLVIIINSISPSGEIFNSEIDMMWFIRSSNFIYNNFIFNKVIYIISYIFIFSIPPILSLILFTDNYYQIINIIFLLFNIILIHTSIGIFTSSYYSFRYQIKQKSLLSHFIHIFLTLIIIYFELSILFINPFYSIIIIALLISLINTKYEAPIRYYVFELFTKFYVIIWLLLMLYVTVIIFTSIASQYVIYENLFGLYHNIIYLSISILTTITTYKMFTNLTIKTLREREEFF